MANWSNRLNSAPLSPDALIKAGEWLAAQSYGPYNPVHHSYPAVTAPPKAGDKRPDEQCKKCQNKGHIVVKTIDVGKVTLFCKLCGKDQ